MRTASTAANHHPVDLATVRGDFPVLNRLLTNLSSERKKRV